MAPAARRRNRRAVLAEIGGRRRAGRRHRLGRLAGAQGREQTLDSAGRPVSRRQRRRARDHDLARWHAELAYVASPRLLYIWPLAEPGFGSEAGTRNREVQGRPRCGILARRKVRRVLFLRRPGPDADARRRRAGAEDQRCRTPTGIYWGPNGMVLFGQGRNGIWHASVNAQGAETDRGSERGRGGARPVAPSRQRSLPLHDCEGPKPRSLGQRADCRPIAQHRDTNATRDHRQRRALPCRHFTCSSMPSAAGCGRSGSIPTRSPTQGNAVPVLDGVSRATGSLTGAANFSVSDDGTLAYVKGPVDATPPLMDIAIVEDPTGKTKPRKLNAQARSIRVASRVSGRTLGGCRCGSRQGERRHLHHRDERRDSRQRLTPSDSDNRYPAWTHDSRRIAFQSNRGGDLGIWWQAADGSDQATRLTTAAAGEEHIPESWTADGTLLYSITTKGARRRLWTTTSSKRKGRPNRSVSEARRPADPMSATFSPDGRPSPTRGRMPGKSPCASTLSS